MGYVTLLSSLLFVVVLMSGFQLPFAYSKTLLKVGSIVTIGLFVLINTQHKNHILLLLSILGILLGETLSIFQPSDTFNLLRVAGYGASLAMFSMVFFLNRIPVQSLRSLRLNLSATTSGFMILVCYWFYPKLTDQLIPYAIYSIVLFIMITTAILSKFPLRLVGFGAALLLMSEVAHLATPLLRMPDYTGSLIWAMAYLGILFITLGIILVQESGKSRSVYREH
jgi:hypothetical protein